MEFDPNPPIFPATWATVWGEDHYGYWQAFEVNGVSQVMRWIVPGRFLMGSPKDEVGRSDNETQHQVTLSKGYWLADTACTQALWQAVMSENPSRFDDDPQNPVERVSWDDCQMFIEKLNKQVEGVRLRLPSEAEWEYACRAGTKTVFSFGDSLSSEHANFNGDAPYGDAEKGEYKERTVVVYSYQPNAWGLWQMHGNVWEWCQDWWGDYPAQPVVDPKGAIEGQERVLRGGGWLVSGQDVRSADRSANSPDYRRNFIGLRLAGG